jgi:hypothetical protein
VVAVSFDERPAKLVRTPQDDSLVQVYTERKTRAVKPVTRMNDCAISMLAAQIAHFMHQ